jgi:hypothetical protein
MKKKTRKEKKEEMPTRKEKPFFVKLSIINQSEFTQLVSSISFE